MLNNRTKMFQKIVLCFYFKFKFCDMHFVLPISPSAACDVDRGEMNIVRRVIWLTQSLENNYRINVSNR